jgi:hypothetical protein
MEMHYTGEAVAATSTRIVSGAHLAKIRNLTPIERADLALDLVEGSAALVLPTITQAAFLAKAAEPTVRKRRRLRKCRHQYSSSKTSGADRLTAAWNTASEENRQEFFRRVGPEMAFDTLTAAL